MTRDHINNKKYNTLFFFHKKDQNTLELIAMTIKTIRLLSFNYLFHAIPFCSDVFLWHLRCSRFMTNY